MIITNREKVSVKMKVLFGFLILDIFLIICGCILKSLMIKEVRWELLFTAFFASLLIISRLIHLRVFQFENTGLIFSVKHYHPLKKGIIFPIIEYPVNRLQAFKREQFLYSNIIIIEIYSTKKEKSRRFSIKVSGLSEQDFIRIANSFNKY